jgi:hypothetical protein
MSLTPAKIDSVTAEAAEKLAKRYKAEDAGGNDSLPMLKINYDETSKVAEVGQWVVGQKKDQEGNIAEEGNRAIAFIPIVMRNSYSLYDSKNTNNNCNSPIFMDFSEIVRGSTHKEICGKKTCPWAAEGKCKAQKVVFGVAITKSGLIDCVGYFGGVSYMPITDYMAQAQKMEVGGITRKVPPYSYAASLDSEQKRNGAVTYFAPIFKRGWVFTKDEDIDMLAAKRDEIVRGLDMRSADAAAKTKVEMAKTEAASGGKTGAEVLDPRPEDEPTETVDPDTLDATFEELENEFGGGAKEKDPVDDIASMMDAGTKAAEPETKATPEPGTKAEPEEEKDLESEIRSVLAGLG